LKNRNAAASRGQAAPRGQTWFLVFDGLSPLRGAERGGFSRSDLVFGLRSALTASRCRALDPSRITLSKLFVGLVRPCSQARRTASWRPPTDAPLVVGDMNWARSADGASVYARPREARRRNRDLRPASCKENLRRGPRGKQRPARRPLFAESDFLFSLPHFHQEIVPMASRLPLPPLGHENPGGTLSEQLDDALNRMTTYTWREPPTRSSSAKANRSSNGKTRRNRTAKRPPAGPVI
jgi:hypothetical protein